MRYCLFYISLFLVMSEAAILDGQFVEKSDINLKQLHLQIILIEHDNSVQHFMRYWHLSKIGLVNRKKVIVT